MSGLSLETLHRAGLSIAAVAVPVEGGPVADGSSAAIDRSRPRWSATVRVAAPSDRVWETIDDLTAIPRYHPEVDQVELLSGHARRTVGARYRCVISSGRRKGWCEERVIAHVPGRSSTVDFPADSWGLDRILEGFRVELSTESLSEDRTAIHLRAYYRPRTRLWRMADRLGLRHLMRRRAAATLRGLARQVEAAA